MCVLPGSSTTRLAGGVAVAMQSPPDAAVSPENVEASHASSSEALRSRSPEEADGVVSTSAFEAAKEGEATEGESTEESSFRSEIATGEVTNTSASEHDDSDSSDSSQEELTGLAALIRKLTLQKEKERNEEKNGNEADRQQTTVEDAVLQVTPEPVLSSFDLHGIAEHIKSGKVKNIIVMCGAGISVSAGIPDFRTPGTGLYDNLQKYNLPHPTAVFELDFFRENPLPFYLLAKELYPGNYPPTATHHFVKLLHEKKLLKRCFTQNIDSLERATGLPADTICAAHGNFDTARCLEGHSACVDAVKDHVEKGEPMLCVECGALVKPDIVFFGENLPQRFEDLIRTDFPKCDLLIVAGTSLEVHPFAGLIHHPGEDVPRLLVNREVVGEMDERVGHGDVFGFDFGETNRRDALFLGDCDDGFLKLAELLGWREELGQMVEQGRAMLGAK